MRTSRKRALGRPTLAGASILLFALAGCGAAGDEAATGSFQNNLFQRTARLQAAIAGAPATPTISWPSTGRALVVAAFFSRPIDVRQNLIVNTNDLVWMWHSGLGRGREGNVDWQDGAPARFGQPQETLTPPPLQPGNYQWAVWTLDDRGKPAESTLVYSHTVP